MAALPTAAGGWGRYDLGMVVLGSGTAVRCGMGGFKQPVGMLEGGGITNLGGG